MKRCTLVLLSLFVLAGCDGIIQPDHELDGPGAFARADGTVDVIVVLNDTYAPGGREANRARAAEVAQGLGLEAVHTYGQALFGFSGNVPEARLQALRNDPRVRSVELDRPVSLPPVVRETPMTILGTSDGASVSSTQIVPWGIYRTGALEQQERRTGAGISVYVLDTGIDPAHPDLQGSIGEGHTVFETTCRGNPKNCPPPATWEDDHGHGTHVAGTIGARDNDFGVVGIAPEVTLHAVKVLDSSGRGSWSGIIAGVDWVAEQTATVGQPTVANMSLGGTGSKTGTCTSAGLEGSDDPLHAAICNAKNLGVIFVVAGGNSGQDATSFVPATYYDAAITVSATNCSYHNGQIQECDPGSEGFTTWSNWGTQTSSVWSSNGSLPVALAAPGNAVLSTLIGGDYGLKSGTSMAAPHVAGAAALILQKLRGTQATDGSAFQNVRAALMGAAECTATWQNPSENSHTEGFLNVRSADPITDCVERVERIAAPSDLRATEVTSSSIGLAWSWTGELADEDITFEIWQHIAGSTGYTHLAYVEGTLREYVVDGLAPATTYYYGIRAIAGDPETAGWSEISEWSDVTHATTLPSEDASELAADFRYECDNSDRCRFYDETSGMLLASWSWDFGNGQTWDGQRPPHQSYPAEGSYTVTLTVTNTWGEGDTASKTITCAVRGRLRCQ